MRVLLAKPVYVGDALYTVPTATVRGAEVYTPVEVDLPDEAAKELIAQGTARPVATAARKAVSPAASAARKAIDPVAPATDAPSS